MSSNDSITWKPGTVHSRRREKVGGGEKLLAIISLKIPSSVISLLLAWALFIRQRLNLSVGDEHKIPVANLILFLQKPAFSKTHIRVY